MAAIIKTMGIDWHDVCKVGYITECKSDCKVGDVVDGCFVFLGRSPSDNTCKKGDFTILIPLHFIDVAETHSDLSQYGFIRAHKENRWIRQ